MKTVLALAAATLMAATAQAQGGPPSHEDYRRWTSVPQNRGQVIAFERFLRTVGVAGVIPTEHLIRTATDWRRCGEPFEVPPKIYWRRIVPTLRFVRDQIRPRIGPVEAVSAYRNPRLNQCSGGAPRSAHAGFWGFDLVPVRAIEQEALFHRLCALHRQKGKPSRFGLGFYGGLRFHVDTKSYRLWGADNRSGTSPCL